MFPLTGHISADTISDFFLLFNLAPHFVHVRAKTEMFLLRRTQYIYFTVILFVYEEAENNPVTKR